LCWFSQLWIGWKDAAKSDAAKVPAALVVQALSS
jgi:hypothetical protein